MDLVVVEVFFFLLLPLVEVFFHLPLLVVVFFSGWNIRTGATQQLSRKKL